MGAKDSKPTFISYEDAVKRVSDSELRRIREAFKRCAGVNGTSLSLEAFVHEVLCDGVPYEVAEWLYQACGGTKRGIAFRELLCGIVVLTKGNLEEKIKFLWTLYVNNQGDNGVYIYKRDFARSLHLENTSLPVTGAQRSAEVLLSLFGPGEKVTFEQFRSWLLIHKDATVLSRWLLSGGGHVIQDLETPTFYQSLAGVTHLEERDIIELEKCFWSLRNAAPSGQLDAASLTALLSPPLPRAAVDGAVLALDENRDGHVDFKELCCGLSAACRGPRTERLKFCFKIFDMDRDGVLNKKELVDMVGILCTVANEALKQQGSRASTPDTNDSEQADKGFDPEVVLVNLKGKLVPAPKKAMFHLGPKADEENIVTLNEESESEGLISNDVALTQEDFLIWSVESADTLVTPFLELLFEVCHIVLGLRPQCKHQERDIVLGWLRREVQRGYSVGQFWYLVGAEWWSAWLAHTAGGAEGCCRAAPRQLDDAIVCDESFTSNSTESMGSLLWRADTASVGSASSSGVSSAAAARPPPHPGPVDNKRLLAPNTLKAESMGSLLWRADTASVGSASSSGVSSAAAARPPPHPGPVDNKRLLAPNTLKVRTLTGEGGHLRRDVTLAQHRDFELVPDALWRALALWYGGPDPLPRQVIRPPNSDVELELYPLQLKILRHVPNTQRALSVVGTGGVAGGAYAGVAPAAPERTLAYTAAFSRLATVKQVSCHTSPLSSGALSVVGTGGVAGGAYAGVAPAAPERTLAYTAAFSRLATVKQVSEFLCAALGLAREDVRLWALGANAVLLDDERPALHELRLDARRLLLELRNPDLTWPEEITALTGSRATERRETLIAPNLPGATGLHNLGNTCFMNAALQSVWNTGPLTQYFNSGMHMYELNTANPLGTKGALALRFGELCKEVWSCSARSVAPLRVRWVVSRHARALAGGGQHDAQELLAWLLDALHEDLNRAAPPPAAPAPADSDGRPDQVVAAESWAAYTARNQSILTELFCGQLKSRVRCVTCARDSVRFDSFNMLSLPLPMESIVRAEVRVILLDGSVPVKYGVRVHSEGTYLDLKQKLAKLCGLEPDSMLLVELSGATIGRVLEDGHKVCPARAMQLYAYELPPAPPAPHHAPCVPGWSGAEAAWAEVSAPRGPASSLCMPALFCFKRSRSEILMSQSPPSAFYSRPDAADGPDATDGPDGPDATEEARGDPRSRTLPRELRRELDNGSPTLSVRSLTLKPGSPALGKARFGSSPSNMCGMDAPTGHVQVGRIQYLVAVHRKQCRMDAYFLSSQRCKPALFGVPLLVGLREGMSGRDIYAAVWTQVSRLLSARPPTHETSNHATDCDDSLGYEFPFTLRLVSGPLGAWCGACAWPALCRGCALPTHAAPLVLCCRECSRGRRPSAEAAQSSPAAAAKLQRHASARFAHQDESNDIAENGVIQRLEVSGARRRLLLAIDWDPTALHLRYQSTREKAWIEHPSVSECGAAAAAVDLASCLRAFTSDERLEQPYHCLACRSHQPASKALQLWRAPPVLIIHLKRFQYVNNKWIKSQKVVNFPFEDFDPTEFLASVPKETILRHRELTERRASLFMDVGDAITESEDSEDEDDKGEEAKDDSQPPKQKSKAQMAAKRRASLERGRRARLQSASLAVAPVADDDLQDFHAHRLQPGTDPFRLRYNLYAVVSHSGQLSGGHYVAYARNPSGAWLCYNDSSCREVDPRRAIDPAAAYLLFYERQGLRYDKYLPEVVGPPPARAPPDADDPDMSRACALM